MKACCCCSLRTGCFVVAAYNMVGSLTLLSLLMVYLKGAHLSLNTVGVSVFAVGLLCVAVALIKGVRQEDPTLLAVWMWVTVVKVLIEVGLIVFIVVVYMILGRYTNHADDIENIIAEVSLAVLISLLVTIAINCVLQIICLAAVRSYREVLLERQMHSRPVLLAEPIEYKNEIQKIDFADQYTFLRML